MKSHKNQIEALNNTIEFVEERRKKEYEDLRVQFYETSEKFRPINIFNQAVKDFKEIPEVRRNLFETLIGITAGYFSKKIIIGKSNSFIKNIFGYVLQYTVTNFISKKVSADNEK